MAIRYRNEGPVPLPGVLIIRSGALTGRLKDKSKTFEMLTTDFLD